MAAFKLLDDTLFEQLASTETGGSTTATINGGASASGICYQCNIAMIVEGVEYRCIECGLTLARDVVDDTTDLDEIIGGKVKISTGSSRGKYYNFGANYTQTQKKAVIDHLMQLQKKQIELARSCQSGQRSYTVETRVDSDPAAENTQTTVATTPTTAQKPIIIPTSILSKAAESYNEIQKNDGCNKKFVRRGNVKDQILAALIQYHCIKEGISYKKSQIARFMGLETDGFSQGESILTDLAARGLIDIEQNEEPIDGFVEKYLDTLSINTPAHRGFVIEIVTRSEERKVGMNSQIPSKIAGTIWLLICRLNLKITAKSLEAAADDTKKSTFIKFYNTVIHHIDMFADIFDKYNIPK